MVSRKNLLSDEQFEVIGKIKDWLNDSDTKVFSLAGAAFTGKRKVLSVVGEELVQRKKSPLLIAPSVCIAKRYNGICGKSWNPKSIYSWLYTKEPKISDGKLIHAIEHDYGSSDADVIIIVESHLLGDHWFGTETRIYGSGYILHDFIESFSDTEASPAFQKLPKTLLIGDPYQLTVGSKEGSLLQCQIFEEHSIGFIRAELQTQVRSEFRDDERLAFQSALIDKIKSQKFIQLPLCQQGTIQTIRHGKYIDQIAESLPQWPHVTSLLRSTNVDVHAANRKFREKHFKAGKFEKLVPGDIVDVRNPALKLDAHASGFDEQGCLTEEPERIDHCNFARVISAEDIYEKSIFLKGRETSISVKFANAKIEYADGTIAETLYLPGFLSAPKPELMQDQVVALGVWAREEANKTLFEQRKGLDSIKKKLDSMGKDYKEELQRWKDLQEHKDNDQTDGLKTEQVSNKEEIAELEKTLGPYHKQNRLYEKKKQYYNKALNALIRNSRYTNAACLRYAYALTVHRAQRLKPFQRVLLDGKSARGTDNPATESYFRFLYTATTCTSNELQIMNYPELTPLSKTRWGFENVRILPIVFKSRIYYQQNQRADEQALLPDGFSSSEPKLLALLLTVQELTSESGVGWCVESVKHIRYLERYSLTSAEGKVAVGFSYNKKYEVSLGWVRVKEGSPELASEIKRLLVTPPIFMEKNIAEAVGILEHHLSAKNWNILSADENKYRVYLIAGHDAGKVKLEIDVPADASSSKKGVISRIQVVGADSAKTLDQFKTDFSNG